VPERLGLGRLLRQVASDDWLSRAVDRVCSEEQSERWAQPRLELTPSSTGGTCPRQIELSMLGYRPPVARRSRMRMDNGRLAHERWIGYLRESGVLHDSSLRVRQPGVWSGEADAVVVDPRTGMLHVVEIKTTNSRSFSLLPPAMVGAEASTRALMELHRPYVVQLTQYIVKFQELLGGRYSDEGFLLFENTDTQDYRILRVAPGPALRREAFAAGEAARAAMIEGRLLEPPFARGSSHCRRCYFRDVCFRLQDGDPEATGRVEEALFQVGRMPIPGGEVSVTSGERRQDEDEEVRFDD